MQVLEKYRAPGKIWMSWEIKHCEFVPNVLKKNSFSEIEYMDVLYSYLLHVENVKSWSS